MPEARQPAYLSRHSAEQKWYCSPLTVLRKVVLAGTKVPQTGSRFNSPLTGTEGGRPCGAGEAGASDRIISPIVLMINPITIRMKADQEDDDDEIKDRTDHSGRTSLNTKRRPRLTAGAPSRRELLLLLRGGAGFFAPGAVYVVSTFDPIVCSMLLEGSANGPSGFNSRYFWNAWPFLPGTPAIHPASPLPCRSSRHRTGNEHRHNWDRPRSLS